MKNYELKFHGFYEDKAIYHSLRLFGIDFWAFYLSKKFGWVKLFGRIFKWKY